MLCRAGTGQTEWYPNFNIPKSAMPFVGLGRGQQQQHVGGSTDYVEVAQPPLRDREIKDGGCQTMSLRMSA